MIDIEQQKIIDSLPLKFSGRLIIPPRYGKTRIVIELLKRAKIDNILYVTPSAELRDVDLPEEFKKWGFKGNVKFTTWASLGKEQGSFETVVFDEEHRITEKSLESIFNKKLKFENIISMSGTKTKSVDKNSLLKKLGLNILYEETVENAIEKNVLSDYKINVVRIKYNKKDFYLNNLIKHSLPIGSYNVNDDKIIIQQNGLSKEYIIKPHINKEGIKMFIIFSNNKNVGYIMDNLAYGKITLNNKMVLKNGDVYNTDVKDLDIYLRLQNNHQKINCFKNFVDNKAIGRTLVFSSNIKNAEDISVNTYHSKTTKYWLDLFQRKEISLLSLVNSGGTGFTFRDIDNIFIQQCNSDRNGDITQKISRGLLKDNSTPIIWLFCLDIPFDEKMVNNVLANFDENKITYFYYNENQ